MNLRIGRIGWLFAPGYSYCRRCRTPWPFVKEHLTRYCPCEPEEPVVMAREVLADGSLGAPIRRTCRGVFALCEKCWRDLKTPIARRPYYEQVIAGWRREGYPDNPDLVESRIFAAVDAEGVAV